MKIIFQIISFVILFFVLSSCSDKKNQKFQDVLEIPLEKEIDISGNGNQFDFRYSDYPLFPLKEKYPKYYSDLIRKYEKLPNLDSIYILSMSFQNEKFFYDLYKNKYFYTKRDSQNSVRFLKDSASLSKQDYNYLLNILSVFKNGKQSLVVDADNDYDFKNNEHTIYGKDFHFENNKNPDVDLLHTVPIIDITYQVSRNKNIIDIKRKVQVFPYPNYFYFQIYESKDMKKHGLFLKLKDYWKGKATVGKETYYFSAQGLNNNYINFNIKPDSFLKYDESESLNKNFRYSKDDTVLLSNNLYKIDSINLDKPRLFLKKVDLDVKDYFGHRIGERIKDYAVDDLENISRLLSDVLKKNKKYTLLDFWGTWCKPCIENLPHLKRFYKRFSEEVNLISIALDEDSNEVKKFTEDNNMKWQHFIVERNNRKGSIISNLRITEYPTFILLDENFKIIFRGGSDYFDELSNLIN